MRDQLAEGTRLRKEREAELRIIKEERDLLMQDNMKLLVSVKQQTSGRGT